MTNAKLKTSMVWVILACVFTLDSSRAETLGNQINADLAGRLTPQFIAFADEVETQIASSLANGDYPYLLRYHIGALLFLAARDLDVKSLRDQDAVVVVNAIKNIVPPWIISHLHDELTGGERTRYPPPDLKLLMRNGEGVGQEYARAVGNQALAICSFPLSASCFWSVGGIYGGVAAGPVFGEDALPVRIFLLTFEYQRAARVSWSRARGWASARTVMEEVETNSRRSQAICRHLLSQ